MIIIKSSSRKLPEFWQKKIKSWHAKQTSTDEKVYYFRSKPILRLLIFIVLTIVSTLAFLGVFIAFPYLAFSGFAEGWGDYLLITVVWIFVAIFGYMAAKGARNSLYLIQNPNAAMLTLTKTSLVYAPEGRLISIIDWTDVKKIEAAYVSKSPDEAGGPSYIKDKILYPGHGVSRSNLSSQNNTIYIYFKPIGSNYYIEISDLAGHGRDLNAIACEIAALRRAAIAEVHAAPTI